MFYCHASKENVGNEVMVLVPTKIRKVTYIGIYKTDPRAKVQLDNVITEGWEIVQEVPVCFSKAKAFRETCTPEIVDTKIVEYTKPFKKKKFEKFSFKPDYGELAEKYETEEKENKNERS